MATTFDPRVNASYLAAPISIQNFTPQLSCLVSVGSSSASTTFSPITGATRSTFMIYNSGTKTAYVGWGHTTATAVVSTSTPTANCQAIPAGAILTLDFQSTAGAVDTLAYIQNAGATTLEISYGSGQ